MLAPVAGAGGTTLVVFSVHWVLQSYLGASGVLTWMLTPGCADPTFGHLCVISNIFFAPLLLHFWERGLPSEAALVALCSAASVVYHSLQVHPLCGPLHEHTRQAFLVDVGFSSCLISFLCAKYALGARSLPAVVGAAVCYILPGLLPLPARAVGYSLLHSAWHGLAALAAYTLAAEGLAAATAPPVVALPARFAAARQGARHRVAGALAAAVRVRQAVHLAHMQKLQTMSLSGWHRHRSARVAALHKLWMPSLRSCRARIPSQD